MCIFSFAPVKPMRSEVFTGIISTCGTIAERTVMGIDVRFRIAPDTMFENTERGESIAVNGSCLSVETFTSSDFTVYASGETLSRTTLGHLPLGSRVNLERALRLGDRLGGHLVTGHVDCVAVITGITSRGRSKEVTLSYPGEFARELCRKGSVTLDGISLTINACTETTLCVNIIPETQGHTTAERWTTGLKVNLETDILGKYVRRSLETGSETARQESAKKGSITKDFLARHGYCSF